MYPASTFPTPNPSPNTVGYSYSTSPVKSDPPQPSSSSTASRFYHQPGGYTYPSSAVTSDTAMKAPAPLVPISQAIGLVGAPSVTSQPLGSVNHAAMGDVGMHMLTPNSQTDIKQSMMSGDSLSDDSDSDSCDDHDEMAMHNSLPTVNS